jgi:hypothetical protein
MTMTIRDIVQLYFRTETYDCNATIIPGAHDVRNACAELLAKYYHRACSNRKTYYIHAMSERYATCCYGKTGWERKGEASRLKSRYCDATEEKVSSKKPKYDGCVCRTVRATCLNEAIWISRITA